MAFASALNSYNRKFKKGSRIMTLHTITLSPLNSEENATEVRLTNYQQIASYSWTDERVPTILVPDIHQSERFSFFQYHGSHFSALHALYPDQSLYDVCNMHNMDLVTDRSNLRKLSYFASGQIRQGFRIDVEIVQKTMIFTRRKERNACFCQEGRSAGYGHEFEKNFLEYEKFVEGSTGHHQIAAYDIGGMKWMVRFEADGYLGEEEHGNDLNIGIQNLAINTAPVAAQKTLSITAILKGSIVPPESVLEVKTGKQTSRNKQE
ncbi:hypothetical protein ACMFMG_007104 [Clarireedia jacksonii]